MIFFGKLVARRSNLKGMRAREHGCCEVIRTVVLELVEPDVAARSQNIDEIIVREVLHVEHALQLVRHRRNPLVPSQRFSLSRVSLPASGTLPSFRRGALMAAQERQKSYQGRLRG